MSGPQFDEMGDVMLPKMPERPLPSNATATRPASRLPPILCPDGTAIAADDPFVRNERGQQLYCLRWAKAPSRLNGYDSFEWISVLDMLTREAAADMAMLVIMSQPDVVAIRLEPMKK